MDVTQPINPPKVPYLHLDQGQGGLYTFPHDAKASTTTNASKLHWIGTSDCYTCVCVYIPLGVDGDNYNQCFVAHIDGHMGPPTDIMDWIPQTPEEGAALKVYVKERLANELPLPANGQYTDNLRRKQAIIVCPRPKIHIHGNGERRTTGGFIVEAIREFFSFEEKDALGTHFAHGFVVNPRTNEKEILTWKNPNVQEDDLHHWDKIAHEKILAGGSREEAKQHSKLWATKSPEEHGYESCSIEQKPWTWTLQYDRVKQSWGAYVKDSTV
ncbi:uncharacterized protein MYCGRDRAFT_93466 [Zymoseptoria tritici IPO323]|uniref:Uncharacterized protein n=1 Tax=Zymoseptoria tritici (strain CBS 115943 / IPO323) TaxID=336722 RepID=F9XC43_ZYMTI|nr:uncharacterized protein MYCGRDRAFT_93466 [Zymoseptoria tritici IPO323]EGP87460.1 hypothetical protein MYCGRDRAFT_93466 [Zymoseptoria tritici IPO323]